MKVAIFEDQFVDSLEPLTMIRPSFALRCGPSLLYEKVLRIFPNEKVCFFMRDHLREAFMARTQIGASISGINDLRVLRGDDILLLNGRWIADKSMIVADDEFVAMQDGAVVYAYLKRTSVEKALEKSTSIEELLMWAVREIGGKTVNLSGLINYPWDLIKYNAEEIRREFNELGDPNELSRREFRGIEVVGDRDRVHIARGAKIYPNTVFDTSNGPIVIDEDAVIYPFTVIFGPSYIGKNSWVVGGKIGEGTAIGPCCRVGGEIEASIIHGYSNKYHEGFMGHSYVCEWVNLGALTTVSDLKNDYSEVEVYIRGRSINSGCLKVGAFIGDHTKTSIGSLISTGSNIGIMCNIVSDGKLLPKYIPSFTWYVRGKIVRGPGIDYMLKTAKTVMARRRADLLEVEEKLLRRLYEETREERDRVIKIYEMREG